MNYLDYIIFAILFIGFLLGFKDGLVRKIIGLIGLIVAFTLAFEFSGKVGKIITPFFNGDDYLASLIAGVLIFLIILLISAIIKRIVHPLDKVNRFINQTLGGIVGIIQMLFFISAILLFLNIFAFPNSTDRKNSMLYNFTLDLIPNSMELVIGHHAKASDYIKQYLENSDSTSNKELEIKK